MKKIILQFIVIFTIIILLFSNSVEIKENLIYLFYTFVKNVIPSLFPIIFITNYIKYRILSTNKNKYIRFLSLTLSYAPSNAIIAKGKKEILYSSVINPLFSFNILINYFSLKNTLLIIIINLFVNYFCLFISIRNKDSIKYDDINSKTLNNITYETTQSIINIFGIVIFFNILISLLNTFISTKFIFFIEITNGFYILNSFKYKFIKNILLIFLNSFGGIAILFQIKSINNDANYKFIFNKLLVSIIVTFITYILLLITNV